MAAADVAPQPAEAAPALPDYLVSPDAILGDSADWRYGRAPDYSNTRKVYQDSTCDAALPVLFTPGSSTMNQN